MSFGVSWAGTFGRAVPIGGHASDIALDEGRGVLYIANFTANRIDVMSLSDYTISRAMNIAAQPGALALSPDGRYLVVTHFGSSEPPATARNALTVINLEDNTRKTFGFGATPLGVAFSIEGRALIATTNDILLFDPASGAIQVLTTLSAFARSLPVPLATFPPEIVRASLTPSGDGLRIFGVLDVGPISDQQSTLIRFSYSVRNNRLRAQGIMTAPALGPRVVSVSRSGDYYMAGWGLFGCDFRLHGDCDATGPLVAQFPAASGALNVGTVAINSAKSVIYAQLTQTGPTPPSNSQTVCLPDGRCVTFTDAPSPTPVNSTVPALMILDADNLTVRERLELPENLGGRSILSADGGILYSISDSGVMVLPVGSLERLPRVVASQEDAVFRGNFCDRRVITQEIKVIDPGGNRTPFVICAGDDRSASGSCGDVTGITISSDSPTTPATVRISVDLTAFQNQKGTGAYWFQIRSGAAVNMPPPPSAGRVEVYQANVRARFRVLVNNREPDFRGTFVNVPGVLVDLQADPGRNRFYILRQDKNQVLVFDGENQSPIATLRTSNTPTQMAITADRKYLLVGHNDSQLAYVYDLDTLETQPPIEFPMGHYPRTIAVAGRTILSAARVAGPVHTIDRVDLAARTATTMPTLGIYKNDIHIATGLASAPNGASIVAAMPNGHVLLYDGNADTFTVSRKDFTELSGGLGASSYGFYAVGNHLLNESLVRITSLAANTDTSSGYAFVDQTAFRTGLPKESAGVIQRMDMDRGINALPTRVVEAPLLTVNQTDQTGLTGASHVFTRTLAVLADRSAVISLTTSGFTVLPWNFDAAVAPPRLDRLVNAADFSAPVAPGGLISVFGREMSAVNLATREIPLPTALGESCLTVNGMVIPMLYVSSNQINAQLPFQVDGRATMVLRTPGGISDSMNFTILPTAPSVFRSGTAGPLTGIPTLVRAKNNDLVTNANPIHPEDNIVIYLTGMGRTSPEVDAGAPGPSDPLASAIVEPTVTLGGVRLPLAYSGLAPGLVGVYQINVVVPFRGVPLGFDIPLTITQGGSSTTLPVRVVN